MMPRVNIPILMLSISLSVTAWFFVYGQNLTENVALTIRPQKDNFDNLDSQLWFVESVKSIPIRLTAPSEVLAELEREGIEKYVKIDLSNPTDDTGLYPVEFSAYIKPYLQNPPSRAEVTLEKIKGKNVPVLLESKGVPLDKNVVLRHLTPLTKVVRVTGPRKEVDLVEKAHGWVDVSDLNPTNPEEQQVLLFPESLNGNPEPNVKVNPPIVRTQPVFEAAESDRQILVSPNVVGEPASGYSGYVQGIKPSAVWLRGNFMILSQYTSITTEPIDVAGLKASHLFRVRLRLPLGVTAKTGPWVKVRYEVKPGIAEAKPQVKTPSETGGPIGAPAPRPQPSAGDLGGTPPTPPPSSAGVTG